ncbi:MAG: hypothetical protein V4502_06170 [Pseudomonadota bacterium]
MAQTNRKTQVGPLPSVSDYLKNGETFAEQCASLAAIKSSTVRIPTAIRAQMRALPRLLTFWATNRSSYSALVEAAQTSSKAQRAGA